MASVARTEKFSGATPCASAMRRKRARVSETRVIVAWGKFRSVDEGGAEDERASKREMPARSR